MPARILDGAALARAMREDLQPQVQAFTARAGRPPGLALVLVGDDPASHVYVGSKRTATAPRSASGSTCTSGLRRPRSTRSSRWCAR